jgi:hypothetical protein
MGLFDFISNTANTVLNFFGFGNQQEEEIPMRVFQPPRPEPPRNHIQRLINEINSLPLHSDDVYVLTDGITYKALSSTSELGDMSKAIQLRSNVLKLLRDESLFINTEEDYYGYITFMEIISNPANWRVEILSL